MAASSAASSTPAPRSARACATEPSMSSGHRRQSRASDELSATNAAERSPAKRPERAMLIAPPVPPSRTRVPIVAGLQCRCPRRGTSCRYATRLPGDLVVDLELVHELVLLADPRPDLDRQAPQLDEAGRRLCENSSSVV